MNKEKLKKNLLDISSPSQVLQALSTNSSACRLRLKTSCVGVARRRHRKKPFCGIPLSSNSDNTTPDISLAIAVISELNCV
ncbi:hypothetical protein [Nostoc sp.]|uniref:hypothetical protein n=1 Tax=Nostoc sp. TaxID=1180 RepID=UPI002FFA728F